MRRVKSSGSVKYWELHNMTSCSALAACSPAKALCGRCKESVKRSDVSAILRGTWGMFVYLQLLGTQRHLSTVLSQHAAGSHSNGYSSNSRIQLISPKTTENKGMLTFFTFDDHFVVINIQQKWSVARSRPQPKVDYPWWIVESGICYTITAFNLSNQIFVQWVDTFGIQFPLLHVSTLAGVPSSWNSRVNTNSTSNDPTCKVQKHITLNFKVIKLKLMKIWVDMTQ
jgi:hypothetical protein